MRKEENPMMIYADFGAVAFIVVMAFAMFFNALRQS